MAYALDQGNDSLSDHLITHNALSCRTLVQNVCECAWRM